MERFTRETELEGKGLFTREHQTCTAALSLAQRSLSQEVLFSLTGMRSPTAVHSQAAPEHKVFVANNEPYYCRGLRFVAKKLACGRPYNRCANRALLTKRALLCHPVALPSCISTLRTPLLPTPSAPHHRTLLAAALLLSIKRTGALSGSRPLR